MLITPKATAQPYRVIIGERGTGKTSLVKLIMGGMKEPKGIIYVDTPTLKTKSVHLAQEIQKALGINQPDKIPDLEDILDIFSHAAAKYKQEYKAIPVLIIDNADRNTIEELEQVQDYAKHASDNGIATVVFVASEDRMLRHMMSKLNLASLYMLIKTLQGEEVHGQDVGQLPKFLI